MKVFQLTLSRTHLMLSNLNNRSVDVHLPLYIFSCQQTLHISVAVLVAVTDVETEMFHPASVSYNSQPQDNRQSSLHLTFESASDSPR